MLYILKNNLLWTQGLPIVLVLAAVAVFSILFFRPLLIVALLFFIFSVYFFRNPERVCQEIISEAKTGILAGGILGEKSGENLNYESVIICPSDGKVIDIAYDKDNGLEGYTQKVSVFLSAFDVHVNWVPVSGKVQEIKYRNGTFAFAFLPKSSELNERNDLLILADNGKTIKVRQIAGMVARRICCWVKEGDSLKRGDKYGMIRFGSRIEIFLPDTVKLSVGVGQRVYGGQTVLGRW